MFNVITCIALVQEEIEFKCEVYKLKGWNCRIWFWWKWITDQRNSVLEKIELKSSSFPTFAF